MINSDRDHQVKDEYKEAQNVKNPIQYEVQDENSENQNDFNDRIDSIGFSDEENKNLKFINNHSRNQNNLIEQNFHKIEFKQN